MSANPGKLELLAQIEEERRKLDAVLAPLTDADMAEPGLTAAGWTVTDLLVHLSDWARRTVEWYEAGLRGETPALPGPGYTWRDLPRLNADVIAAARGSSLGAVRAEERATHERIVAMVRDMPEADLVTQRRFAWTGPTWSVGQFVAASTSSHDRWARALLRKWLRSRAAVASVAAG